MSQAVHLMFANNVGSGMPDKCLPCLGVSGRTAVYSCPSLGHPKIQSRVKIGGYKCSNVTSSFVCKARRNPDFSRQNRHGPSRGRNRNNDGRDIFENFEEDMLSSKNGPLGSLSNSGKSQATSTPGPREKEIVELFRKVQARLRERAAVKEDKKVEAPQGHVKEKSAVESLLNLLKKHSAEQVKRSGGGDREKDFNSDQFQEINSDQESNKYDGGQMNNFFNSNSTLKDESREANISSMARPRSSFQRRSPVPRIKYEPISNTKDDTNVVPISSGDNENNQDQIKLKLDDETELESEPDLETKDELFFPELSEEEDSHDSEQTYNDESVEEQLVVQNEDLSALKLSELRVLAKSRGLKGFSKMKKGELVELLTES